MSHLLKPSLHWLLIFVPIAIGLEFTARDQHTWIFIASCLAIVPLAGILGEATEHLAERTNESIGGLLNATFGNAAELIISIAALREGLYSVVKASLTGSIIGNILLVLGASIFIGGAKHKILKFNATAARSQATMLTLASISLVAPAAFHYLGGPGARAQEYRLSVLIAILLLLVYVLSLFFSLKTHRQFFSGEQKAEGAQVEAAHEATEDHGETWSVGKAITVLAIATAFTAWISEILVGSVEPTAKAFGMSTVFVGVIVVAIIGNAAEHSTAVLMAMKNKMDLTIGIAIGSSIQIALFVAPLCVLMSAFIGPGRMDLVFTSAEVLAVVLAATIAGEIASDGESNWLEGVQLLAVYLILAFLFFYIPELSGVRE